MAALPEPNESLKEKALKALEANWEAPPAPARPAPASGGYAEEVELRLLAIRTVRDLEPKRSCQSELFRILTRRLLDTPSDSIHYEELLQQLRVAHAELRRLEQELWKANHKIRATQWLVELLDDPGAPGEPQLPGGSVR